MNTPPTVHISVIICTHNRGDILSDTLESLVPAMHEAAAADIAAEAIIVDNNSDDATGEIARQYSARHTWARYVFEPQTGLSYARNCGIRESQGEILAFADDDVLFDPGWLKALVNAFHRYLEAACVGGKTLPLFAGGTPPWLHANLLYMYGATDYGDAISWFEYPKHPFGVNMAFRREIFDKVGCFNPRLGRIGKLLLSGEEAELFKRVHSAGYKILYTPCAILHHRIPAARTEKSWVLKRSYWQGVSEVVYRQIDSPMGRGALLAQAFKEARWLLAKLKGPSWNPKTILWHIHGLPFYVWAWYLVKIGVISQSLREAFRIRPLRGSA